MADRNGYIGRAPSDSAVTVARQTFTPTGVTTDFTFASGYTPGYFDLFINGVKMIEGSDFTSPDGLTFSILNGGATNGDIIEGVAYKAFNAATATVGINSAGTPIGSVNTLNFVGTGNTFALRGSSIDISISGGAGAGGTWTNYDSNAGVTTSKKVRIQNDLQVTGVATAVNFSGNITGTAATFTTVNAALNGNANTATLATNASGLSGSPNITITNLTGVAATFSGAVVVGGILTYDDVTNVDSIGLVTARSGIEFGSAGVGGTISALGHGEFVGVVTTSALDAAISFWTLGASGSNHYTFTGPGDLNGDTDPDLQLIRGQKYVFKNRSGGHPFRIQSTPNGSAGTAYNDGVTNNDAGSGTDLIFDVPFDAPSILYYQCTSHGSMGGPIYIGSSSGDEVKLSGGVAFDNLLRESAKITAGKLSDNTNIDLENGMVHLFTTTETTTSTPNLRYNSSTTLNSKMAIGEVISVTLITTAAAAGYSAQLTIDGNAVTENWTGGSAPSVGGSSGVDIYAYAIIKTADATFTVIGTLTTTS